MPYSHLAFLRAIGPITHKVMSMQNLCAACAEAGFSGTHLYVTSGNLLFNGGASEVYLTERLNAIIAAFGLHLDNQAFIRTPDEMTHIIEANPFPTIAEAQPNRLIAMFFNEELDGIADKIALKHDGEERFASVVRVLYGDYSRGIGTSKVAMGFIEKRLQLRGTARNWNTVLKMQMLARG